MLLHKLYGFLALLINCKRNSIEGALVANQPHVLAHACGMCCVR
jgi:hypothetical protein